MKIFSIGLDNSILNKTSALARRVVEYGDLVEKYTVIVPSTKNEKIKLSGKAIAYGSGGGNKLTQFFKIYKIAKKLLDTEKFDVITVQDQYYLALIGLYLSKKFKVGLEIQVHGFEKYQGLRKLIFKIVLPRAEAVRTVSQRLRKRLVSEFGIQSEKIIVIPIYVAPMNKPIQPKKEKDKFIFLTIGRLVSVKNIGLQIKAVAKLIKDYKNIELWIVGDGDERVRLEEMVKKLQIENNIKFWGWQENVYDFYSQADIFMLTSWAEGWPLVIVEASCFGLPIIMTDVGSAGELIINNESGIVIPVGDVVALADNMLKLITNRTRGWQLGADAKSAVAKLPDKAEILAKYLAGWEKILAARGQRK